MTAPAHTFKTARRQLRKIRHRGPRDETERRLVASADRQREEGLGWRYDGFGELTTAAIFENLGRLSLPLDEESFRREALEAGSPTRLWEQWQARVRAEGKWRDLPMLAARELWRRLLPDQRTPEVAADEVDELLERAEIARDRASLWLEAARRLLFWCCPGQKPDPGFFEAMVKESGADLVGWMVEMPSSLVGTPHADQAPGLCESFGELVNRTAMLAERAEILARLGRREEAIRQIEQLLETHPEEPIVLLKAGGTYEVLGELEKSQLYLRLYTAVMQGPAAPAAIAAASKAKVALKPVSRPAPNDRCFCGSGKKFKRCHGMLS